MTQAMEEVGMARERAQILGSVTRILSEGGEGLDQEARDAARDALAKIVSHEILCTERWTQQHQAMIRTEGVVNEIKLSLNNQIGRIPAGIIAVLMSLTGWLAARAFPFH